MITITRKTIAMLATIGAIAAMAITTAPASAAPDHSDCAIGHLCLYEHEDFGGEKLYDLDVEAEGRQLSFNLPDSARDRVSSWVNLSSVQFVGIDWRLGGFAFSEMWAMNPWRQDNLVDLKFNDRLDEITSVGLLGED